MSTLDQAFIKAYTRSPGSQQVPYEQPQAAPTPPPLAYPEPVPAPYPDAGEAWFAAGARHRVDASHPLGVPSGSGPHAHLPPQAYADLAYVNPYYYGAQPPETPTLVSPPHFDLRTMDPEAAAVAAPVDTVTGPEARQTARPAAAPQPAARGRGAPRTQPQLERPADARETLHQAASIRMPSALELPSIFRGLRSDPAAEQVAQTFSPDWEVDHFVWPEICDRLLAAEAVYFQHVGERLLEATQQQHHVLMIAGCRRGEGRTTLALCLARCAAQAGAKVAVVDADLQNPQLGERLGMEIPCGWSEVLRGQAPLNEAAVSSVADHLTLFPLPPAEPAESLAGDERAVTILREISAHYPLVILDVGPLGNDGRHPFSSEEGCPVNAAMVVRDLRYTTERKAQATAELLAETGIPAVGIAENFCSEE